MIAPRLGQDEPLDIGYTIGVEVWDFPWFQPSSGDPRSPWFEGPPAPEKKTFPWWILIVGGLFLFAGSKQ